MSAAPVDQLKELLRQKQQTLLLRQTDKAGNQLANKQNRWQRFNRYVWDKKQG